MRSIKLSENTAEFIVYGAKKDTRNNMLVKDASVEFSAGYADSGGAQRIFVGNVIKAEQEKQAATWAVRLTAANIKQGTLTSTPVSLTYAPGSRLVDFIADIAALLNMVTYGLQNAENITLPNGLAEATTARGALRYAEKILRDNGKALYRDNDEIVVYNVGEPSFFDAVSLNFNNGLVSLTELEETEEQKKAKAGSGAKDSSVSYRFESLLYPQIRPNGLLRIDALDDKLNGGYIPTSVEYFGDNRAGPFNCQGEVDKL
jgi:hypothetical protein